MCTDTADGQAVLLEQALHVPGIVVQADRSAETELAPQQASWVVIRHVGVLEAEAGNAL
jgi:hypothetical protein